MSRIIQYSSHVSTTSNFGSTMLEARTAKKNTIASLTQKDRYNYPMALIEQGYTDTGSSDPTLGFLKEAKGEYADIYGNIIKYRKVVYK